jgi:hypothetical protein
MSAPGRERRDAPAVPGYRELMTEQSPPETVDPGHEPGVDPPPDNQDDDRGPVDQSEREDRPGVTEDPDDPDDTDFPSSAGLVE